MLIDSRRRMEFKLLINDKLALKTLVKVLEINKYNIYLKFNLNSSLFIINNLL